MAGGFDKNKDYAAAIKKEKDPGKRNQLIQERQNKIDHLNKTGQNKWGATNAIYGSKYSTITEKGGSSGGGSRGGWESSSAPDYATIAAEAKRQADYATKVAYQNASQVKLNNAALEKNMKETDDTYSGFNKATVDNTREEGGVSPMSAFGYFNPNMDYAAEIEKEKDPTRRKQMIQERNNKVNWLNATGKNEWGASNSIYGTQYSTIEKKEDVPDTQSKYTPYFQDYTQGWSWDNLGRGAREELNDRVNDIRNAMRENSAAYAAADPATQKQLAAENQAYAEQLNKLGVSVRQFEPGGSWYYTDRMVLQGDPYESPYGFYKWYDVPEDYDMFVNNNEYADELYAKDPKIKEAGEAAWGDLFMNAADMQAGAIDDQLRALQAQLKMQRGENNSYYDDIAAQAYIAKRQAEAAMPQRLAAYGISGGGSESAQLGLDTSYQNNLNANELARQNMLQQLDYQNILAQSQANSDKANIYAQAQKDAYNAYLQQKQWEQQQAQWDWQKDQWQQEFNWQRQQYENELKYKMDQDEWQRRQFEIDLALEMGDYTKLASMGYNVDYLQQMQNYELQEMAQQAMKSSNSRSSSSRSAYSGGGDTGGYIDGGNIGGGDAVVAPVSPTPQVAGNIRSQLSYQDVVNQYNNTANKVQFKAWLDLMNKQGVVSDNDYIKAMSALGLNQADSSSGNFMQRFF